MTTPRTRLTIAPLVALAAATLAAPNAVAGTYKAVQCHEPIGAGHADASFGSNSNRYESTADCAGRGLGIIHRPGGSPTAKGRFGAWTLAAPAGTEILQARGRVRAQSDSSHVPQMSVATAGGGRDELRGVRGPLHTVTWNGTGGRSLTARLSCARHRHCGDGRDAHIHLRRVALTLRDAAVPQVAPQGSLFEPGPRRGRQGLEIAAADGGSGVHTVTVDLNGDPLAARVLDCALARNIAIRLRPCPSNATPRFDVDTSATGFRQGPNQVRVCAADFGRRSDSNRECVTRTVRIDNLCPVSDVPGAVLRARFVGGGDRLTTRSDAGARVAGTLLDRAGDPVSGAEVCVAARPLADGGRREKLIATPTTDGAGGFEARIPAGPSREVRVAHWPDSDAALERHLTITSRAVPRLRLRPDRPLANGDRLRFSVALPGPGNGGRSVAVQARAEGRWIRIAGGRTSRRGRWTGHYRFRSTTGTRRYSFRAVVPKQPGYPYAGGRSKTRHATVSG